MSTARAHVAACALALLLIGCSAPMVRPTPGAPTVAGDAQRLIVVTLANPVGTRIRGAGFTWRGWGLSGGYRVAPEADGGRSELSADYGLEPVDDWPIALLGVHCVVYRIAPGDARETLLRRLAADARVESAQALNTFSAAGAAGSGRASPRSLQYSLASMQIPQAHRWASGRGVRVAVVDTGVDFSHPQMRGRVAKHFDFVGQDTRPFEDDRHGTAVAGIIAAGADGSADANRIVGVAPSAELLALKACWPLAPGAAEAACNTLTLARALAAAVELEADVLNLSLTGPPDPLLKRLLDKALARGTLVIGALSPGATGAQFPADVAGVIAVRAEGGRPAGRRAVAAPGEDVISLAPRGGYALNTGSSFAAAHVSGVAALVRERRPQLASAEFERLLLGASTAGADGGVSACRALALALGRGDCSP